MLAHTAKLILPTKENPTNRLPGDLNRLPSSKTSGWSTITTSKDNTSTTYDEININGTKYRQINTLYCCYRSITKTRGALIDRGANGGLARDDERVMSKSSRTVNVQDIYNHQCINIPIVTAGAVTRSPRGPIIIIMNQYACIEGGKTIQSSGKMEAFQNDVHDKSVKISGGAQYIITPDDHTFPLNIKSGLPYTNIHPYADDEWKTLTHVILTPDDE